MAQITLSRYTRALLENFKKIVKKPSPEEDSRISVSQTASFFALVYEKIRNAVEYRESHLIRRSAISRILNRRLSLNPEGKGEAENLLRELLWARYFPNESLDSKDIKNVQAIIDKHLYIRKKLSQKYSDFLFDLLTCEIEELLSPEEASKNSSFLFFIYHVLKNKVKIMSLTEEQKDIAFYVALERAYSKSDISYLRFHLFVLSQKPVSQMSKEEIDKTIEHLPETFGKINKVLLNPYAERLRRFIQDQLPPFHILFELIRQDPEQAAAILQDTDKLWGKVDAVCKQKYAQTRDRLRTLAIKAILYIFLTKMIFALILEYPLSLVFYDEINYFALVVNSLFPPLLMFLIVAFTKIPTDANTKRLFERLVHIIDADRSFESSTTLTIKQARVKRPILIFSFTVFYSFTFFLTFLLLHELLSLISFNLISQAIFLFFVSLVAFFGYRITQIAKEYKLREKDPFVRPFIDFFFMPILSVGKFLSKGLSKLNFFTVIFDFFIEAPFKIIIEVIEEWINFVKAKREEMT